jgi:PAS domain S-box-containing protein
LIRTRCQLTVGLAAIGPFLALLLPASPARRLAFGVLSWGLLLPWSGAVLVLSRRSKSPFLRAATAIGDVLLVFLFQLAVPELRHVGLFGYLLLVPFYAFLGGRRSGFAIGAGGIGLTVLAQAFAPPGQRLDAFILVVFALVVGYLAYLVGGASEAQREAYERERSVVVRLREIDRLKDQAQELAHVGSWSWDIESNRVMWSDELYRIYGLEPQQFVPTFEGFLERVHPDDRVFVADHVMAAKDAVSFEFVHRLVRPDGEVRTLRARGEVVLDANGTATGMVGTGQDITDWHRSVAIQAQLAAIVESSDDPVFSTDPGGVIASWNPSATRVFGYEAGEVIGRSVGVLNPSDGKGDEADILAKVLAGERVEQYETQRRRRDGTLVDVSLTVSPILDPGKAVVGTAVIARDVSGRKAAEAELAAARDQALEASRLKSAFLASMSHEIRTPMNAVIGMTGILLDSPLSPEQRECADIVRASGNALLDIINDILDFSKIEAGKMRLEVMAFDLRQVVEEATDIVVQRAQDKKLELVAGIDEDVPTAVVGDPGRLRQVLINLLGNAVKFTDRGTVAVRTRMAGQSPEKVSMRFEVSDTGVGIPSDQQQRLFEPFQQGDSSSTRRHGGTGLGLAISRQIVEMMDGEIGVRSEPGAGSTFWFTATLEPQHAAATIRPADLEPVRALVVDDNTIAREALQSALASLGARPEGCGAWPQAMDALRTAVEAGDPFDVALVDADLPEIQGWAQDDPFAGDPALGTLKIVLVSSGSRRGSPPGRIDGFLAKPVRLASLRHCVASAMGGVSSAPSTDEPLQSTPTFLGRVLVAEDNPVNQRVAVRMLERIGYRADVVADGREAVKAVSQIPYAAVLMDCQMPEMDGYQATVAIRALEAAGCHTPVIAMTAGALLEDRAKCLAAGMDAYVSKPVSLEQLRAVLDRWTRGSRAELRSEHSRLSSNAAIPLDRPVREGDDRVAS